MSNAGIEAVVGSEKPREEPSLVEVDTARANQIGDLRNKGYQIGAVGRDLLHLLVPEGPPTELTYPEPETDKSGLDKFESSTDIQRKNEEAAAIEGLYRPYAELADEHGLENVEIAHPPLAEADWIAGYSALDPRLVAILYRPQTPEQTNGEPSAIAEAA